MDRPTRVAMPWYRREDYPELLRVLVDASRLPPAYDAWRLSAEQVEGEITRSGIAVMRVEVRPAAFLDWCSAGGLAPDSAARSRYAEAFA